jgi:hypothetical protein
MSGGSGCAITTGATAAATVAWCGALVTITSTIITGITIGIAADPARRCVVSTAQGSVLRRVFRTEGPPIFPTLTDAGRRMLG